MSETVIIDEQALEITSLSISTYTQGIKEALDETLKRIQSNNGDWDDEDYENLLSAISSFMADIDTIEQGASQILHRVNEKLDQIKRLRGIKI
ncbi:MAG: hypothetical protein IJF11_05565 [Clostridia bacterium]|nr:hypothetical protein [Clostridia bacterium]